MTACLPKTDKGGQMPIYVGKHEIQDIQTESDIQVGCLVVRQKPQDMSGPDIPCLEWTRQEETDNDPILGVCVGLVIDAIAGESEVIVQWLQKCPHGRNWDNPNQEGIERDRLRVVGKLN